VVEDPVQNDIATGYNFGTLQMPGEFTRQIAELLNLHDRHHMTGIRITQTIEYPLQLALHVPSDEAHCFTNLNT
jgi:hypothetical protein